MSSEAVAAESLDARADLFSVGVIAWEMITGRRCFPSPMTTCRRAPTRCGAVGLRAELSARARRDRAPRAAPIATIGGRPPRRCATRSRM